MCGPFWLWAAIIQYRRWYTKRFINYTISDLHFVFECTRVWNEATLEHYLRAYILLDHMLRWECAGQCHLLREVTAGGQCPSGQGQMSWAGRDGSWGRCGGLRVTGIRVARRDRAVIRSAANLVDRGANSQQRGRELVNLDLTSNSPR